MHFLLCLIVASSMKDIIDPSKLSVENVGNCCKPLCDICDTNNLVTYKIYSDRHFSFQWSATEWSSWECLHKSFGLQGTQGQDQSIAIWEKYVKFLYNKYYLSFFFARKWFFGSIVFILYGGQGFMPWEGMPRASQCVPTDPFISLLTLAWDQALNRSKRALKNCLLWWNYDDVAMMSPFPLSSPPLSCFTRRFM